jgi:hypothetical protein
MQKVRGSNPLSSTLEVFTFQWGPFSRLGLTFWAGRWSCPGRVAGRAPEAPFLLSGCVRRCARARCASVVFLVVTVVRAGMAVRAARRQGGRGFCGGACGFSGAGSWRQSVRSEDLTGLRYLKQKIGSRMHAGYVLYCGTESLSFGDGLGCLPISSLWTLDKRVA